MVNIIKGKAFVVGSDIDTDQIIPARYMTTMDPQKLAQNAMRDLDPKYGQFLDAENKCAYQIVVAQNNFGCGSSREHAPIALAAAGIKAVIANSFARIYYRNSVNGGRSIYPLETADDAAGQVKTGDELEIDLDKLTIKNLTNNKTFQLKDFGPVKEIIDCGGLTAYNKKQA
ncbi:3-isopropylmalate dehydratase small subunit [Candidatus Termititenax dinenymphae]|uniref:3-isopropylmalate dehydratase small subunit n=1 Tax=Candidatus Termititenax dinenymphae TaxID=2218523 RepID=A0A388TKN6_9BACT|nr:3-isopropylmalate dehydratase small subunit [Candidatus Termititenax dinenymphae]